MGVAATWIGNQVFKTWLRWILGAQQIGKGEEEEAGAPVWHGRQDRLGEQDVVQVHGVKRGQRWLQVQEHPRLQPKLHQVTATRSQCCLPC